MGHHSSNHQNQSYIEGQDYTHLLGHIVPRPVYLKVFIALLVLTLITVGVAHVDISPGWNITLALIVATIKGGLVVLFFMHMMYENKVTWLYFIFPIVLVAMMIAGVYTDNPLRFNTQPIKVEAKN